tara:strand:+ start:68 stop:301 length:234 start_codon:yes stop_codon:yes gene_type:complete
MSTKIVKKRATPTPPMQKAAPRAQKTMIQKSPPPKKIAKTPSNYARELELIDINKNNKQRRNMVNKLQTKKKKTTEV